MQNFERMNGKEQKKGKKKKKKKGEKGIASFKSTICIVTSLLT